MILYRQKKILPYSIQGRNRRNKKKKAKVHFAPTVQRGKEREAKKAKPQVTNFVTLQMMVSINGYFGYEQIAKNERVKITG